MGHLAAPFLCPQCSQAVDLEAHGYCPSCGATLAAYRQSPDNPADEPKSVRSVPKVSAVAAAGVAGSIAVVTASITCLFLGMRAVMAVGGRCVDSTRVIPGVPHCPHNVGAVMPLSVVVGLGAALAYGVQANALDISPDLSLLPWTGLFWSLGFNFLQAGAAGGGGSVVGWLIGGMFIVMGAGPLFPVFSSRMGSKAWTPRPLRTNPVARSPSRARETPQAESMVVELERLASLHREGALSDDEYRKAKASVLKGALGEGQ